MRIDFHTHIWNTHGERVEEFVAQLPGLGIDKAVVLPIAPYMSNDDVASYVNKWPEQLIGFCSVLPFAKTTGIPRQDPIEELERSINSLGLSGLKLHPIIQGFSMDDPGLVPVVSAAGDLGVPVLLHTGPANGEAGRIRNADIELLDDLAIMCPRTVLIAGHADPWGPAPYLARKHPNVYLETSISWPRYCSLVPGLAKQVIELSGPQKILFGTDLSLGREERVSAVIEVLEAADISDEARELIYYGNAERILKLVSSARST